MLSDIPGNVALGAAFTPVTRVAAISRYKFQMYGTIMSIQLNTLLIVHLLVPPASFWSSGVCVCVCVCARARVCVRVRVRVRMRVRVCVRARVSACARVC